MKSFSSSDFTDYCSTFADQPKYVILGCQGSGTNMASRLLQSIFRFSVVHDRSLIFNSAAALVGSFNELNASAQFDHFCKRVFPGDIRKRFMLKRHYRQAKHFKNMPRKLDFSLINSPAEFAHYLYAYHGFSTGATHLGLKSDDIWESLEFMDDVLPNRRYLLLVRDPRDNALSISNKDFGPRNLFVTSAYVKRRMDLYRSAAERMKKEDVIIVRYEDLLSQPIRELERISNQWNLTPVEDIASQVKKNNIRRNNQKKWLLLSKPQLETCESILKDLIVAYGYELNLPSHNSTVGAIKRLGWQMSDVAQRIPQRLYKTCRNLVSP